MYFAIPIPHYCRIIDVRFYVSVLAYCFDVDVDDMLQLIRGGGGSVLLRAFFTCFAYVFDLGMPLKFVVDNET